MSRCKPGAVAAPGLQRILPVALISLAWFPAPVTAEAPAFPQVYELLQQHCGECHVQGMADGPWSLNTPPSEQRFPQCLTEEGSAQLLCATYHQLVDEPGPGIPAWIRPAEATRSEPYVQACDPTVSFHLGHSLPAAPPEEACRVLLDWIESGAPR